YQADVPRSEVHDAALEIVSPERTALAPLLPLRREHEMVDDQLRALGEQVAERDLSVRSVEHVRLVDPHPWEFAPLRAQTVPRRRDFLLPGETRHARRDPLLARDDPVAFHLSPPSTLS